MTIGIIGSGAPGSNFARILAKKGISAPSPIAVDQLRWLSWSKS